MTLSGEQWLEQVLLPEVAGARRFRGRRDSGALAADALRWLGGRLAAQVEALADTGVLTEDQERMAVAMLEDAAIMPETRSISVSSSVIRGVATGVSALRTGSVSPVSTGGVSEAPRLLGVSPGPRPLGQFDGRAMTLVSVELWSDRFAVDLYIEISTKDRAARREVDREHLEWFRRTRRGESAERPSRSHRPSPLQALQWELRDERSTPYSPSGGSGEWGEHLDRLRISWRPAPPPNIDQLTLIASDSGGTTAFTAEIIVPNPSAGDHAPDDS